MVTSAQFIREHLKRLGAGANKFKSKSPVNSLIASVESLQDTYCGRVELYRAMLAHYQVTDLDDCDDEELEAEMPLITGFTFADENGFYDGWRADFPNASKKHSPIANNDYYYYFLMQNIDDPADPLVFAIDHEEPESAPESYYDLTIGGLLASIEAEPSAKQTTSKHRGRCRTTETPPNCILQWQEKTSSDTNLAWDQSNNEDLAVIELTISHQDFNKITEALAVFWQCIFSVIGDRRIMTIDVCDLQEGFGVTVNTKPRDPERLFYAYIDRMLDEYDDPEMMEKHWRSAEIGLHKSGVLKAYSGAIDSDFKLTGTALANKKFRRDFKPRTR